MLNKSHLLRKKRALIIECIRVVNEVTEAIPAITDEEEKIRVSSLLSQCKKSIEQLNKAAYKHPGALSFSYSSIYLTKFHPESLLSMEKLFDQAIKDVENLDLWIQIIAMLSIMLTLSVASAAIAFMITSDICISVLALQMTAAIISVLSCQWIKLFPSSLLKIEQAFTPDELNDFFQKRSDIDELNDSAQYLNLVA